MYKYIRALIELISALRIVCMSFIALSNLVILSTLNVLNILIDLNAEIAPPPDYKNISTSDNMTIDPSM
jgi:hypothetical protein